MAGSPAWLLAVLFCPFWALIFHPVDARADQTIYIELRPRGYSDPRAAEDFICGLDTTVDPQNFLAELNADYIFDFLDNTGDNFQNSRTQVFDVVTYWRNGDMRLMVDEFQHALSYDGLVSLFLAPSGHQCNSQTFEDAREAKEGYYPVFIGNSDDVWLGMEKFLDVADELKSYYDDQYPKLCGSISPMKNETAAVRASTLHLMFNFKFNADVTRNFQPAKEKTCEFKNETLKAMEKADVFDFNPPMYFEDQNITVSEGEGSFSPVVKRTLSVSRRAVGFVTTPFQHDEELNWASRDDIVPYSGPISFKPNEDSVTISIQVKEDDEIEENEYLSVEIYDGNDTGLPGNRSKRSPGGGGGGQSSPSSSSKNKKVTVKITDSKPIAPPKPKFIFTPDPALNEQQNKEAAKRGLQEWKREQNERKATEAAEEKTKKVNAIKNNAIKRTGLTTISLESGKIILEENDVKYDDIGSFFTISLANCPILNKVLDIIDPKQNYKMRRTKIIFLELGTPQPPQPPVTRHNLYNAGLLHLIFGKAGPDRVEVQVGKKTMYQDKNGDRHGPGHGQEFEMFFREVTDYKIDAARINIAGILEKIITTWPAYGWTSDPVRGGVTLGFHGLITKEGNDKGKEIFVNVAIGSNGYVVTTIVTTEPDYNMKTFA